MITNPNVLFQREAIKGNEADFFAGRQETLRACLNALGSRATSCVIYGERGVGKTSLAWQVATILDGTNSYFTKQDLMAVGQELNYGCVFHKCQPQTEGLSDLLLQIIRPSPDHYSLSRRFPGVYEDERVQRDIERKYQVNLFSLASSEWTVRDRRTDTGAERERLLEALPNDHAVGLLFEDLILEIHNNDPDLELIIFVDEIDQMSDSEGLGTFLKNINFVRFAFVGIASSIGEIISDHRSAGRYLIGGDIHVPTLDDQAVTAIFRKAEQASGDGIRFGDEFIARAVKYSAGFPWIAQNVGYQAVFQQLTAGAPADQPLHVGAGDFDPAIRAVMRVYEKELGTRIRFGDVADSVTQMEILELIWNSSRPLARHEIREEVRGLIRRFVPTALARLEETGILVRADGGWRFADPIVRILWRFYADAMVEDE